MLPYLDRLLMHLFLPDIVHHLVHGPPVVELLLKPHALASHLYAHKHVDELLSKVGDQGMLLENLLSVIPAQYECGTQNYMIFKW